MFGKKGTVENSPNYEKMDTLIGKDTSFEGNIVASGTIRIDGKFKGDINIKGDILIGDNGKVEATLNARNVLVAGYLKGNVTAAGKVDLAATGKLYGDIRVKNIVIEEGGLFKGNCVMQSEEEKASQMQKSDIAAK